MATHGTLRNPRELQTPKVHIKHVSFVEYDECMSIFFTLKNLFTFIDVSHSCYGIDDVLEVV